MLGANDLKPRINITETSVECPVRGCNQNVMGDLMGDDR